MDHIRSLDRHDIRYTAYSLKDGKTFVHLAQYENIEAQNDLHNFSTFKVFSKERDAHIEIAPDPVEMTLVGSTFDLFTIREEHIEF
ncbi:MAG: hypothetical protein H7336_04930 [Bacteriovorax sp.]|nr:hypothetical protein [Bacteriovorax sp.]